MNNSYNDCSNAKNTGKIKQQPFYFPDLFGKCLEKYQKPPSPPKEEKPVEKSVGTDDENSNEGIEKKTKFWDESVLWNPL